MPPCSLLVIILPEQPELRRIARGLGEAEMMERMAREKPPARGALDEAPLDQEWLDDFLNGVARFGERSRDRLDPDRPAAVVFGDHRQIATVHGVEARGIDFELAQRAVRAGAVDRARAGDQGEIADAAKEPSGDARRAARALGNLVRA